MPAQRRRSYEDERTKISQRQLREEFGDAWRSATSVALTIADVVTVVQLIDLPCAQTFGGTKRWFRCPSCARKALTLAATGTSWSCAGCGRWAWRDRGRLLREPQRGSGTAANQGNDESMALPRRCDLAPSNQAITDTEPPCCP